MLSTIRISIDKGFNIICKIFIYIKWRLQHYVNLLQVDKPWNLSWNLFFFDDLSPFFIGNWNICIATMAVPLAAKKSYPTGTKFELKLVWGFLLYWKYGNISFWNINSFFLQVQYYKIIIVNVDPSLCLIDVHFWTCSILYEYCLLLRPLDQQQRQLSLKV